MDQKRYNEITEAKELDSGDDYSYEDIQFKNDFRDGIKNNEAHLKNRTSKMWKKKQGKKPTEQRRLKEIQKIYTETARDVDKMNKKKS